MKIIGSSTISEALAERLSDVEGLEEISANSDGQTLNIEAKSAITEDSYFTTGLGFVSQRSLLNRDVEADTLKAIEQEGYDALISRPIETRNDGSFVVSAKKRSGPSF